MVYADMMVGVRPVLQRLYGHRSIRVAKPKNRVF